ncbi:YlmH family RNA-binding protein [Alicyclobacillus dauci]|uniref:YlmH/Sll1252 family protein n=1 Tax=Alicyclobacillus dauci TaxID=1475485 RepID=A0ABY6YZL1_9BACL|nr:YlmH/Sll1252 family protein [Alicyclobacillus dauci]WAH35519.1 YlmH/Sll1252 family protein [Alicyclobacillus dauci]
MSSHAWVRESERPFVRSAEDWCDQVGSQGRWLLTDFLTPREQYLTESVVGKRGLAHRAHGGYGGAERHRMLIMPDDWYPQPSDFEIVYLRLVSLEQEMRHKDVLGSVLGLGLQRKTIGDIVVGGRLAHLFVSSQIARFLYDELHHVGRTTVSVTVEEEIPDLPPPTYDEKDVNVPSLRLDAVIASACQFSRSKAQAAVERGDVTLNFAAATSRDEVDVGDTLSVRGFGRIKVMETLGITRRERLRLRLGILRSNA